MPRLINKSINSKIYSQRTHYQRYPTTKQRNKRITKTTRATPPRPRCHLNPFTFLGFRRRNFINLHLSASRGWRLRFLCSSGPPGLLLSLLLACLFLRSPVPDVVRGSRGSLGGQAVQGVTWGQAVQGVRRSVHSVTWRSGCPGCYLGVKRSKGSLGGQVVQGVTWNQSVQGVTWGQADQGVTRGSARTVFRFVIACVRPRGRRGQRSPCCECAVSRGLVCARLALAWLRLEGRRRRMEAAFSMGVCSLAHAYIVTHTCIRTHTYLYR